MEVISVDWEESNNKIVTVLRGDHNPITEFDTYQYFTDKYQTFIWDINYSSDPEYTVNADCAITAARFSKKQQPHLLTGLESGQVALYDSRVAVVKTLVRM